MLVLKDFPKERTKLHDLVHLSALKAIINHPCWNVNLILSSQCTRSITPWPNELLQVLPRYLCALKWLLVQMWKNWTLQSSYQSGINVFNSQEPVIYAVYFLILHTTLSKYKGNTDCLVILLQITCENAKINLKKNLQYFCSLFPPVEHYLSPFNFINLILISH